MSQTKALFGLFWASYCSTRETRHADYVPRALPHRRQAIVTISAAQHEHPPGIMYVGAVHGAVVQWCSGALVPYIRAMGWGDGAAAHHGCARRPDPLLLVSHAGPFGPFGALYVQASSDRATPPLRPMSPAIAIAKPVVAQAKRSHPPESRAGRRRGRRRYCWRDGGDGGLCCALRLA